MSKIAIHVFEFKDGDNVLKINMVMSGPKIDPVEGEWALVEIAQAVCDALEARKLEMTDSKTMIAEV